MYSGANIINSVINQASWPLYSILSDLRCTKLHSQRDKHRGGHHQLQLLYLVHAWFSVGGSSEADTEYIPIPTFCMLTIQQDAHQVLYISAWQLGVHVHGAILSWLCESPTINTICKLIDSVPADSRQSTRSHRGQMAHQFTTPCPPSLHVGEPHCNCPLTPTHAIWLPSLLLPLVLHTLQCVSQGHQHSPLSIMHGSKCRLRVRLRGCT